MKRIFGILLILLLLFGCGRVDIAETTSYVTENFPSAITGLENAVPPETACPTTEPETVPKPADEDFVLVSDYIPNIVIDLKYASTDNFTGQVIYESDEAYLRYGTVKKLILVQEELEKQGLSLKLWDGYRPLAAQWKLWDICPNANYVSDPNKGFSSHSRGNTVDVTLVDEGGVELEMPTGFDDFTKRADRDYSDCTTEQKRNARMLEELMIQYGFKPYAKEWWHYSDTVKYDVAHEIVEGADPQDQRLSSYLGKFVIFKFQPVTHINAKRQQGNGYLRDNTCCIILDKGIVTTDINNGTKHLYHL